VGPRPIKIFDFFFKFHPHLIRSKIDLNKLENFEIKYVAIGFELRNNFPYSNFSRFEMEFELKFRDSSRY
jgi:hypothetical protein